MTPFLYGTTKPGLPALVWPFPHNWQSPASERLEWRTWVHRSASGKEQRSALRDEPRLAASFQHLIRPEQAAQANNMLRAWRDKEWAVPAWWGLSRLTLAAGDTLTLDRPTRTLWPAAGWGLLWRSADDCELVEVDGVGTSSLTLTSAPVGSWPAGSLLVPLHFCRLESLTASAPTSEVTQLGMTWLVTPGSGEVLQEPEAAELPTLVSADDHNWREVVQFDVQGNLDTFDPGGGLLGVRPSVDITQMGWRLLRLLADDQVADMREWLAARRGSALTFRATNPVVDVEVDTVLAGEVTFAQPLLEDDPSLHYLGIWLRGDLLHLQMATTGGPDATGVHTITGTWPNLSLSPLLVADTDNWTLQFRPSSGGLLRVGALDGTCTYVEIDSGMVVSWSDRNTADSAVASATVGAGALVELRYANGWLDIFANGVLVGYASTGPLVLRMDQIGNWLGGLPLDGTLADLEVRAERVGVSRTGLVTATGVTLDVPLAMSNITAARLLNPVRLAADAVEITHHTARVAEVQLPIITVPVIDPASGGGGGGSGGGGGEGETPGLLMHFDNNLVDAYRDRAFSSTTVTYDTRAFAGSHSLGMTATLASTQVLGDFDFGVGDFTISFAVRRLSSVTTVAGDVVRFLGSGGDLIWKVSHAYGEALATPSFWAWGASPVFVMSPPHSYPVDTWQEVEIRRQSGVLTIKLDGTTRYSGSFTLDISAAAAGVVAGRIEAVVESDNVLIDELRVVPS